MSGGDKGEHGCAPELAALSEHTDVGLDDGGGLVLPMKPEALLVSVHSPGGLDPQSCSFLLHLQVQQTE